MTDNDELRDEKSLDELLDQEHGDYIATLVRETGEALLSALSYAAQAYAKVEELMSDGVYDVEIAEGNGGDALAELDDAKRSLRNAKRIIAMRAALFPEEEKSDAP